MGKSGNLYITGAYTTRANFGATTLTFSGNGGRHVFVAKLSNKGSFLWAISMGGGGSSSGTGVAMDSSNSLYVTGQFGGLLVIGSNTLSSQGTSYQTFVAKFSDQGQLGWITSTQPKSGSNAKATSTDIAVDSSGNSYLVGYYNEPSVFGTTTLSRNQVSIFIAKLNNKGSFVWALSSDSVTNSYGYDITLDSKAANLYITGKYNSKIQFGSTTLTATTNEALFVTKVDVSGKSGKFLWALPGGTRGNKSGGSLALDSSGKLYITGSYSGVADFGTTTFSHKGTGDIFVARFDY